jgi:hypothetical protein
MSSQTKTDAPKQTLPNGHPEAGYKSPDLSFTDGAGTLPPEEQKIHDERNEAQADEAEEVAAHEDKVAKAEAREREADDKKRNAEASSPPASPAKSS